MKAVAILTALCLIGVIWLLIKGTRDAKEVYDDNELLTQDEIDAFMARAKDRRLSDLIDQWGRKKFYKSMSEMPDKKKASQMIIDRAEGNHRFGKQDQCGLCGHMNEEICNTCSTFDHSENKRGFQNRSDMDSLDMEFMNTIH